MRLDWGLFLANWWREFVFAGFAAALYAGVRSIYRLLKTRVTSETKEQKSIKRALVAVLHDRLRQSCLFFIHRGEISHAELDNITKMHESYVELGGNGGEAVLFARVQQLSIRYDDEA